MGGSTGRQMRKVPSVSGTEFVSGPIQVETKGLLGASLKSRWVVLKGRWLEEYASERKAGGAGRPLRSIDIFCAHQRDGPEAVDIEIVGPNLPPPGVLRLRADAASSARWRRGIGAALSSVHCSPDARSDSPSCLKGAKREDDDEEREAPEASYERRRAERVDWLGAGLEEFYAWKDPAKVGKNTARLADSHVFEEFKLYVRMAVKYPDARESGKLDWLLEPPESTVSDPRHAEIGCGIDLEALVEHERRVTALETKMRAFYMAHARERVGQERTVALVFVGREGELAKVMAKHHADATEHLGFLSSDEVPFNKRAGAGSPASLLVQSLSHTREATREGTRSPVRESSPTLDSPSIEKKQSIRWDSSVKGASRPHKAMQPRGGKPAQKQDKGPGALQRLLGKLPGKGARDDDEDDASPDGGNDG